MSAADDGKLGNPAGKPPTVAIAFDACERTTVETLLTAGRMPNLAKIVASGFWTPIGPRPAAFHSMPWVTFLQGASVLDHGWYAAKRWDPESMRLQARTPPSYRPSPFWERLDPRAGRIAVLDVPFMPLPKGDFNGIAIQGWQNHDQIDHFSVPDALWHELASRAGPRVMTRELCTTHTTSQLAAVRSESLRSLDQFSNICADLLQQRHWNLFFAVFGATHRIGHYVWDTSQAAVASDSPGPVLDLLNAALQEVYTRCDDALGRLMEAAPDCKIVVFSLHGMRKETGWSDKLASILGAIPGIDAPSSAHEGLLYRVKKSVSGTLTQKILYHLPYRSSDWIVPAWSRNMHDWARVRSFVVPGGDSNGLIRINLKGRERLGTVAPGDEYEEVCNRIVEGLMSFRDIDSQQPIVASVERTFPRGQRAEVHSALPDLVVNWGTLAAYGTCGVVSDQHGEVRWQPGWKIPSGRSGDHSPRGWLAACGPQFAALRDSQPGDIAQLGEQLRRWVAS